MDSDRQVLRTVLLAFYGWPTEPTIVLADRLEPAENAVIAIWEQQWPSLRFVDTFATRSRLDSTLDHTVQIGTSLARGVPATAVVLRAGEENRTPPWMAPLVDDLQRPGGLRDFLWCYGPDAHNGRAVVPNLVRIFEVLSARRDVTAFGEVASVFRDPADMAHLKEDCLSMGGIGWSASEPTRLLAALEYSAAVDTEDLELGPRIAGLWPDRENVARLALAARSRSVSPRIRAEIVEFVGRLEDPLLVVKLASSDVRMAAQLCARAPSIVLDERLWSPPAPWQVKLIRRLKGLALDSARFAELLLANDRRDLVTEALRSGIVLPVDVLTAASAGGANEGALTSLQSLLSHDELDAAVTQLSGREASWTERLIAAASFSPNSATIVAADRDGLLAHLPEADGYVRLRVKSALFLHAYQIGGRTGRVIRETFPELHRRAVDNALPSDVWSQLDRVIPAGNGWDRAERLRKALLKVIDRDGWEESEIAEVVQRSGPEAWRLRDLTDKRSDLRKLLDAVWDFWGF